VTAGCDGIGDVVLAVVVLEGRGTGTLTVTVFEVSLMFRSTGTPFLSCE
jgi:hypothetical protein